MSMARRSDSSSRMDLHHRIHESTPMTHFLHMLTIVACLLAFTGCDGGNSSAPDSPAATSPAGSDSEADQGSDSKSSEEASPSGSGGR